MSTRSVWQQLAGQLEAVVSTHSARALGEAAVRATPGLVVAHPTWPALPEGGHGGHRPTVLRRTGPATDESWLLVLEPAGGLGLAVRSSTGLDPPFAVADDQSIRVRVTADPGIRVRVTADPGLLSQLGAVLAAAASVDDPAASAAMRSAVAADPAGPRGAEPGPDGRAAAMLLDALASADEAARADRQAGRRLVRDLDRQRHATSARLHDGPVQDLTAALLLTDAATDAAAGDDAAGAGGAPDAGDAAGAGDTARADGPPGSALQALRRAITGVRRLMHDLSRDLTTGQGLEAAVRAAGARDAACHVDVPDETRTSHPDVMVAGRRVLCALLDEMVAEDRRAGGQVGLEEVAMDASERVLGIEATGYGLDGLDLATVAALARLWTGHVERSPGRLRVELPLPGDAVRNVEDP